MINGAKNDKLIFVISDKKMTELHTYILKIVQQLIKSSGLYMGKEEERNDFPRSKL